MPRFMMIGGITPVMTYIGVQTNSTTAASANFTVNEANPTATRIIVAVITTGRPGGAHTVTSVTINGVGATLAGQFYNASGTLNCIAYAVVPTGTSFTTTVNCASTLSDAGYILASYRLDGTSSLSGTAFGFVTGTSTTVTTSGRNFIIANSPGFAGAGTHTSTWSGTAGLVKDGDQLAGTGATLWASFASLNSLSSISSGSVIATPNVANANSIGGVYFPY